MTTSRIDIFEQMLAGDPGNTMVMFGLAKEYEKAGDEAKLIETLERYLAAADDEGNAYGMLARAFERTKQSEKAREAYQRGARWPHRTDTQAWLKNTKTSWRASSQCRRHKMFIAPERRFSSQPIYGRQNFAPDGAKFFY
jgi:predicted Zn-dependent protease